LNIGEKKSPKELAFLLDLYVMPDWGERFGALLDEKLELPKVGRILYVEAGTGGHAMAVQERLEDEIQLVAVDHSDDALDLARAKATAIHAEVEFLEAQPDALPFADDEFDLVIGDASLSTPRQLPQIVAEVVRVAAPGGTVAIAAATAASFGEVFSVLWEAVVNSGLTAHGGAVEHLIAGLPTVSAVEEMAKAAGLASTATETVSEEFHFDSGEAFLNSPLITDFLLPTWLLSVPDDASERVLAEIRRVIDEERHEADFTMTVKATVVLGKKAPLN
jgi:ubiquinone/menaquinone biosynthesis C-methylase UbiE